MKKINILKNNRDFTRLIKTGKRIYGKYTNIYYNTTNEDKPSKFGISVRKKIGNAVIRNKYKRQIRNILNKNEYKKGNEILIMTKPDIINSEFKGLALELNNNIKKFTEEEK